MAGIFEFPETRRAHNARVQAEQAERRRLAEWLREVANHIEGNDIEREPLAAMVILSSRQGDEVLHVGYRAEGVNIVQAGRAAWRLTTTPYSRRGGNFFEREE